MRFLLRLFARRPAAQASSGDFPTQHISRKGQSWQEDGDTVRLRTTRSERLAWPARDRSRPDERRRPASVVARDEAPTRLVDSEVDEVATPEIAIESTGGTKSGRPSAERIIDSDATRIVTTNMLAPDPVVGWLVVVEGRGRGNAFALGNGANSIGRGPNQKICLDFGDATISRDRHASLIYDPAAKKFYLQSGDGRGLTYLNGDVLLAATELRGGETLMLGDTKLQFVAFCGPKFNW